ncbi:COX19 [Malassezia furfur]|mgnify:FL=1|nr:COX19 [Malassezia furfur]
MSFGRPPTFSMFQVLPPERGSFPLDHYGDCKDVMKEYLQCLKANKNDNGACRHLSKKYLQCRMDKYVRTATHAAT